MVGNCVGCVRLTRGNLPTGWRGSGSNDLNAPTDHLHLEDLEGTGFERLCLDLLHLEGYRDIRHLGGGVDQFGLDLVAERQGRRIGFQCKNVRQFGPRLVERAIATVLASSAAELVELWVLVVACNLGAESHRLLDASRKSLACEVWSGTELERRIRSHPTLLKRYFGISAPPPSLAGAEDARGEQERQAFTAGGNVEVSLLGIAFRLVPAGRVELPVAGVGELTLESAVYLARSPLSRGQWRTATAAPPIPRASEPWTDLAVDQIERFVDDTNVVLTEQGSRWRLDVPFFDELRFAMAVGSRDEEAGAALGLEDFFGAAYQCCRYGQGGRRWVTAGGPREFPHDPAPWTRWDTVEGTSGARTGMGFRPALRHGSSAHGGHER